MASLSRGAGEPAAPAVTSVVQAHGFMPGAYIDPEEYRVNASLSGRQSSTARVLGRKRHADVVVRGQYEVTGDKALVTVHFELLRDDLLLRSLGGGDAQELVDVAEMEAFGVQARVLDPKGVQPGQGVI